jgi:L-asparagine transporter-like permease
MVASFFVVISLNLPPIDTINAFITLIICTMGIYICIVVTLSYRERRRYECKRRVKIGFRKERLPLFFSDLVLTVLMIFLFTITHHAIRWIFLFFGIFVLIVGLIGLILKPVKG